MPGEHLELLRREAPPLRARLREAHPQEEVATMGLSGRRGPFLSPGFVPILPVREPPCPGEAYEMFAPATGMCVAGNGVYAMRGLSPRHLKPPVRSVHEGRASRRSILEVASRSSSAFPASPEGGWLAS